MPSKRQTLKFKGNKHSLYYPKREEDNSIIADIEIIRCKDFTPSRFGYNILLHYYKKYKVYSDTAYTLIEARLKATDLWCQYIGKPEYLK